MGYRFTDFNSKSTNTPGEVTGIAVYYGRLSSTREIISRDHILAVEGLHNYQQGPSNRVQSTSLRSANMYPANKIITLWLRDTPDGTLNLKNTLFGADRIEIRYSSGAKRPSIFWGYVASIEEVLSNSKGALIKASLVTDGMFSDYLYSVSTVLTAHASRNTIDLSLADCDYKYIKNVTDARLFIDLDGESQEFPVGIPGVRVTSGGRSPVSVALCDAISKDVLPCNNGTQLILNSRYSVLQTEDAGGVKDVEIDKGAVGQTLVWALPWLDQTAHISIAPVPSKSKATLGLDFNTVQ